MPLEVRGAAILDPAGRSIRFAGYPVGGRGKAIVICEVSGEALRHLSNDPHADKDELLGIFETYKDTIFKIASDHFDKGEKRPQVNLADFKSDHP